jgi:hypothetical protein
MFKAIKEFFFGKPTPAPVVEQAPYKVEAPAIPEEFTPPPKAADVKAEPVVAKAEVAATVVKAPAKKPAVKKSKPPVKKAAVAAKQPAVRKPRAPVKK